MEKVFIIARERVDKREMVSEREREREREKEREGERERERERGGGGAEEKLLIKLLSIIPFFSY